MSKKSKKRLVFSTVIPTGDWKIFVGTTTTVETLKSDFTWEAISGSEPPAYGSYILCDTGSVPK